MYPEECPNAGAWREGLSAFRRVDAARERWLEPTDVRGLIDACEPDFRRLVHCLRHTYASLAVQSGMALVALARNLGHADTRMVEKHYGHLSDRYLREQVQRFAPTFGDRPDSST